MPLVPDLSGSVTTGSPNGDNALMFSLAWGERLTAELPRAIQASHDFATAVRAYDRGDDWGLSDDSLAEGFRAMWTANAAVVWTASQVERWLVRLAREVGEPEPEPDADLKTLRDALEHLDEAVFDDDDHAYADRSNKRTKQVTRALHRLEPFAIASWRPGGPLFNLIDVDQLRTLGRRLGDRLSAMLDDVAEDAAVQEAIDRMRQK
jgi:hypothetical protein